ncbi:hypothetical protein PscP78CL_13160 [Pseudomonas syringae]|nr:hypothetical protein [Pseudomonas syringae]NAP20872.1 hypothetical protein [Pseudomonas syringae]NAP26929.1 hypothetical protein [Pseudomonas syringae]NAP52197.1 hypothetical protein [Pseudomonas syringae]NAP84872.1 hypothetical protein [Pseudomonas syringae]
MGHFRVRRVCVLYRSANPRQSRHPCLFSSRHLINMAKAELERSLECVQNP